MSPVTVSPRSTFVLARTKDCRSELIDVQIAAAFSNAEICRLLLSQGADADAAATSIWSGKDDHGAILIFESGT